METIDSVLARQILDSRGNPTIEVEVKTSSGMAGRAAVPSGASTGEHEAIELRDHNKDDYRGKSVHQACRNVHEVIAPKLKGWSILEQNAIDRKLIQLDGTYNKANLGANALLGVSLAVARAGAATSRLPLFRYLGGTGPFYLPVPQMNILNGGVHGDNKIDFQEFMIMPVGADSFGEALRTGSDIFYALKSLLKEQGNSTNVGDEGGFAPNLDSNEQAIDTVIRAIEKAGYKPGSDVYIALDAATSEMYDQKEDGYRFFKSTNKVLSSSGMVAFWEKWLGQYPIVSVEDGLDENDWNGWKELTGKLGGKTQLVGDDLFVTNTDRLKKGIEENIANSILIKLNQIGTLTETIEAVHMAHRNGYTSVISHRSGETEDTFIADLAVALSNGQIKTGSLSRTDRVSKYNQLLRIEELLGDQSVYSGKFFKFG